MKKKESKIDKSKVKTELRLQILLNDHDSTNQKIEQFIKSQIAHFYGGATLIFGILAIFGNMKEQSGFTLILYLIPITLLLYFGVIMYHYQRTYALQGYKKYLEEKINKIAGEKLIFYGELGMEYMERRNRFVKFNMISNGVLFVISIVIAFLISRYSLDDINDYIIYTIVFVTLAFVIVFVWALAKLRGTSDLIYEKSKELNKLK